MQPIIKYILLLLLLQYSLELPDVSDVFSRYVCPENHFLVFTKKRILCPENTAPTGDSLNNFCDCAVKYYFDAITQKCEKCPVETAVVKNLDGTTKSDPDSIETNYLDHGCPIEYIFDDSLSGSEIYKKSKLLRSGELIVPENRPCADTHFYNEETRKCEPCNSYKDDGENKTYYFYQYYNDKQCDCKRYGKAKFFWNTDTKKCESCQTLGIGSKTSYTSSLDNDKCPCLGNLAWNPDLKQCIANNENSLLTNCEKRRQALDKKTKLCKDCPEGSLPNGGYCYCEDKNKYFNITEWKCVKNSEYNKNYHKRKTYINHGETYYKCLEGYPENKVTGKCTKCPKGSIKYKNKCLCSGDKYWDKNAFDCLECPSGSNISMYEDDSVSPSEYIKYCECHSDLVNINGTCVSCPEFTTYNYFDRECKVSDEAKKDTHEYNKFYHAALPIEPEGHDGVKLEGYEFICLQCPPNSIVIQDSSNDGDPCFCYNEGEYYNSELNVCNKTRMASSGSGFLRLGLFFFSLILFFL